MRVYLAAAMTNPARDLDVIQALRSRLLDLGHNVLTPQVAADNGRAVDQHLSDTALAARDLELLAGADVLVAEVSAPSHGVGIEVATATRLRIPTLTLHRSGACVSRLLLGLPGLVSRVYAGPDEAVAVMERFLGHRVTPPRNASGA